MADLVDLDAKDQAFKALYVLFILGICASSVSLLSKLVRRAGLLKNQRRFLIFSLTTGDLFLALFSLTVNARLQFEGDLIEVSIVTRTLSRGYQFFYFPFVYAVGLIILAVELMYRERIRAKIPNPYVASFLFAGLPWLLGLIVVIPLITDGFNWSTGQFFPGFMSNDRLIAWHVVSNIIPITVALITCILVDCVNIKWVPEDFVVEDKQENRDADVELKEIYHVNNQPSFYPTSPPRTASMYNPDTPDLHASRPPSNRLSNVYQDFGSPSNVAVSLAPSKIYLPGIPQPPPPANGRAGSKVVAKVSRSEKRLVKKEKRVLLGVSTVCLLLSIPYALVQVTYTWNDDRSALDPIPREILNDWFLFFLYLRSVMTPFIWLAATRKS